MASPVESMPPPMALPHQSPSPAPDQSAFRPSSRSGNHSHPYAIVTSSSALLTRTNSTGHGKSKVSHSYTPASPSTPSRIITNPHNRTHRHTRSMSSVVPPPPLPIPPSPSTPSRMADHWGSGNVSDGGIPRPKRSETMPVFPNSPTKDAEIKIADLPDNPKVWTPTQLSVYLSSALRVKGADKLPAPVAKDIAAFVIKERIAGRVFLRLTEEDLEEKGINRLWRNALLSASRSLRKKVLKGRIWGFGGQPDPEPQQRRPNTVPEASEHGNENADSETPDKPPQGGYRRGRVRGMVETLERSSSSASSGSSAGRRSPIDLDMDDFPEIDTNDEAIRNELRAAGLWDSDSQDEDVEFASGEQESPLSSEPAFVFPPPGIAAGKAVGEAAADSDSEPTMEELLSREAQNDSNGDAWGARAWELDADLAGTARRVVDTIQPSSRKGSSKRLKNSRPPTIKGVPLTDVFGGPEGAAERVSSASPPPLPTPPQERPRASEIIEAFKIRLEEIERRLTEMEKKDEERDRQRAQELERQQALAEAARTAPRESTVENQGNMMGSLPSSPSLTSMMLGIVFPRLADRLSTRSPSLSPRPSVQNMSSDVQPHPSKRKRVPNDQISDLTPAALPQYVLLVGLGVCAVILRVLLRRVSGKR